MRIIYDQHPDALYIELRPLAPGTVEGRPVTEDITLDFGPDGKLAGIEILDASALLGDYPDRVIFEIAPALRM